MSLGMTILVFSLALVFVTFWLYLASMLVTREMELTPSYLGRLLLTAFIAIVIIPPLEYLADFMSISHLAPVVAFVGLVYAVRYIIEEEVGGVDEWAESIWITFITLLIIYVLDNLLGRTGLGHIIPVL